MTSPVSELVELLSLSDATGFGLTDRATESRVREYVDRTRRDRAAGLAFTGEVGAAFLVDAGCTHVIVGHSERRQLFGERDDAVHAKARAALEAGLVPIVCVGETLEERESGLAETISMLEAG